ncbi:MAG: phosphoribosylaminoimidazole carboxylase ATPase subunit [Bacillales bacterium]|jgi:5-(carboxyamino)imidazole ribonucleotide synthase|nr:phosphoribosylaminoimidazole carboxylase ATPase subunit [Bacillales bacterium]
MSKVILPPSTIGIIGGGQLGRMMALSAKAMGYKIASLDPTTNSPLGQIADYEIIARYDDLEAIKKLADVSDVITYEFENISYESLNWLEKNTNLPQKSALLKFTQNRITEKKKLIDLKVNVAPFQEVNNISELEDALESIGFPSVLKTCTGGYDGKGQVVLKFDENLSQAKQLLESGQCVLEKWIDFRLEISVIVVRNSNWETRIFPVAENNHRDNILHTSIVPARISSEIKQQAKAMALQIAEGLDLVGTLAIEMFVANNGEIYVNELAPRPHNSGHYTMDGCLTSQFEQHIRAICNLPLGHTDIIKPVVMVNILGEHLQLVLDNIDILRHGKLHLYGKADPKHKRKMGHINFPTNNIEEALTYINSLKIWNN